MVTSYGPFKIAENESPLPQNRGFLTYNYYAAVLDSHCQRETLGIEKTVRGGVCRPARALGAVPRQL